MRIIYRALIVASMLATTTAPAIAKDRLGNAAIQAGDYVAAERMITAQRRIFPNMPELMLNLALVYARTGRPDQARNLYRDVLRQDAVELDTSATASAMTSHDIARAGLGSLTLASK